ncbi:hypothetical protein GQ457_05G034790 [Hibiscus cannabinus]
MLRRYRSDLSHVMPVEEIELYTDMSYDEEPVEILTSDGKVLRGRTIELVKVKWRHRGMEEATWERKEDMREWLPCLFPSRLTGFTALEGYFEVIGSILEVGNDVLLLGNGWGKTVWVVRARNWKLRGGENRLSGLLEGDVDLVALNEVLEAPDCEDRLSGVARARVGEWKCFYMIEQWMHARDDDMMIDFTSHALCCLVLPPDREVEFVIETQTDSAPVSISPYSRSPKELKELKTQLQELLDRGFIRLSTSTWGTPRLRKCVEFEWSDARQQAFEKLKEALTNAPVLIQPVSERELYMRQRRWLELLKDYDLRLSTIRRAPVCWAETRQKLSPLVDILKGTTEKVKLICDQLKIASDRQKSYVDLKRREIEASVSNCLSVDVASRVERIHDVFHVSMLRRYRSDLSHVMPVEEIELYTDMSYDEEPVEILTSDGKVLRGRTIELVKVKWRHRGMEEATWERKEDMREWLPCLFPSRLTGFTALEGYFEVIGSILEVGNDVLLLGNGWGKTVWVVRARNWKLRGGENRLSGLLEGVSIRYVSRYAVGEIELNPDLSYDEEPVEILACRSEVATPRGV